MSADLNTSITMRGSFEELLSMIKVLQLFESEKLQQYRTTKDCGYIEWVNVQGASGVIRTSELSEQKLIEFLSNAGNELIIDAAGPWGAFCEPGEVGLFEALSEAAPNAFFDGNINGFVTGADVSHIGKLIDGKLHLTDYYVADETFPELYVEEVEKKLSYSKFCKLFNVDKEEFELEYYSDFIMEASEEGFPNEMDYDTFMEFCDCAEIDEEQFENALNQVADLGIVDFETFCESINEDDFSTKSVYNPIEKVYE